MAHLISFNTSKFDTTKEPPNPINPIAGHALLKWLRQELTAAGWHVKEPDAEDWGWYVIAQKAGASYLVGASGEIGEPMQPNNWIVQIHRKRSFVDRLTGKNKMGDDDALTLEIEKLVRGDANITGISIEREP